MQRIIASNSKPAPPPEDLATTTKKALAVAAEIGKAAGMIPSKDVKSESVKNFYDVMSDFKEPAANIAAGLKAYAEAQLETAQKATAAPIASAAAPPPPQQLPAPAPRQLPPFPVCENPTPITMNGSLLTQFGWVPAPYGVAQININPVQWGLAPPPAPVAEPAAPPVYQSAPVQAPIPSPPAQTTYAPTSGEPQWNITEAPPAQHVIEQTPEWPMPEEAPVYTDAPVSDEAPASDEAPTVEPETQARRFALPPMDVPPPQPSVPVYAPAEVPAEELTEEAPVRRSFAMAPRDNSRPVPDEAVPVANPTEISVTPVVDEVAFVEPPAT